MDVAYLDLPHVEHVERKVLLLRVSPPCWDDECPCRWPGCICACHDDAALEAAAEWREATDIYARQQARARREADEARARLLECTAEYFRRRP